MRISPIQWTVVTVMLLVTTDLSWTITRARAEQGAGVADLHGRVHNPAGEPLAGARVLIPALGRETVAGTDGSYRLPGLPIGRLVLEVRWGGYAPLIREVTLGGDEALDLSMTPTPFQLPGITVTATRSPIDPLHSPLPVGELNGDRLRREQGVSLAKSLENLAGARNLHTGGEIGKPMIRGLTGSRVLVLDAGHRLEDYSWSAEDGPSIDVRSSDRVEVIRGPASLMYGSDALGGVVNAVPAALPRAEDGPAFVHMGYEAYFASNNKELGTAVRAEGARGGLGWRLFGIGRHSEALRSPDGELENTGFTAVNGEAAIGLRGERNSGELRLARYGGEFKLLEANGPPPGTVEGEEEGPERKNNDVRAQFSGRHFLQSWWFETRAQYQSHHLQEVSDDAARVQPAARAPRPAGAAEGAETVAFDLTLKTLSGEVVAHHALGGRGTVTLGISGFHQDNDSQGPIVYVPVARTNSGGAFALAQLDLGRVTLLGGGRLDGRRLRTETNGGLDHVAQSRSWDAGSGDVGLTFRPIHDVALSANVGQAWRAPNVFELFANGALLAEHRYEVGSATLRSEQGLNADVAVRWEYERVRGELAGFRNRIRNFIFNEPTGLNRVVGADTLDEFHYDQADAVLLGGEATVEVAATDALNLRGRFDYVRGEKDQAGREPLPEIPPARGTVGVEWHRDRLGGVRAAHIGVEGEFVSPQTRRAEFEYPDPATEPELKFPRPPTGYTLVHLSGGLDHDLFGRSFTLDVAVRNLLNTRYRDWLSRYKEFALDPGLNLLLRVSTGL